MMILATSVEKIVIAIDGPADDLTPFTPYVALVADDGSEPGDSDYHAATWLSPSTMAYLPAKGQYPAGLYMAFARVVATPEDVRMRSGRVRIGDTRP